MKNILITGGAGFIGSALSLKLIQIGYHITVLDNLSPQIHGNSPEHNSQLFRKIKDKTNFIKGSVENNNDWIKALKGQDAVIHLAAETGTGQSMYEINKYVSVNISGTAKLMDILTNGKHTIKKVIIASSRAIYGEGKYFCLKHGNVYPETRKEKDLKKGDYNCKCPICNNKVKLLPTSEDSRIHPASVYGITKQNQEQMVLTVGRSIGVPAIAFRYQNVYGPGQSLSNPYTGILSIFSTQIRNDNDINVFEDGKESRDFVYIDDVVDATILGLQKEKANYEVFNVGSEKPTDVITIAEKLKKIYKTDININITGNYRIGDIRHNYADLSKIKQLLGFKPSVNFDTGLKNFCKWVVTQKVHEDNYQTSITEMKKRGLYK